MLGHAHESLGSVIMIFCRLKLNRYWKIVNQTLMLPDTFLAAARHDERSPAVKYLHHSGTSGHGDWPLLGGTALAWMFVRYWLFGL